MSKKAVYITIFSIFIISIVGAIIYDKNIESLNGSFIKSKKNKQLTGNENAGDVISSHTEKKPLSEDANIPLVINLSNKKNTKQPAVPVSGGDQNKLSVTDKVAIEYLKQQSVVDKYGTNMAQLPEGKTVLVQQGGSLLNDPAVSKIVTTYIREGTTITTLEEITYFGGKEPVTKKNTTTLQ